MNRIVAGLAALQVLLVVTRLVGLWPCVESCGGGGYYRYFAGIEVLWFAVVADLALFATAVFRSGWLIPVTWSLAGVAVFFSAMAWGLGLICPFCLIHHGLALGAAVVTLVGTTPRPRLLPILACLGGALGTNAVFHHGPVADVAAVADVAQPSSALPKIWRGPATSPTEVEVVLDPMCPHCAAQWGDLRRTLMQAGVRWRVLVPIRPSQPASADLATAAQQAASEGETTLDAFWSSALGLDERLTTAEVLRRRPELARWFHSPTSAEAAIRAVADQNDLKSLHFKGRTPLVVARRKGAPLGRWEGDLDLPAIAATLRP